MQHSAWARIAIHFAKGDAHARVFQEVLDHAGLRAEELESFSVGDLGAYDVLVLCGYGQLGESVQNGIKDWVFGGGALVCCGSPWSLDSLLGLSGPDHHASNAQLEPKGPHALLPEIGSAVRFFGGNLKRAGVCEVVASVGEEAGIAFRMFGRGMAIFYGPHLGQSITTMQTGLAVECDGVGPEDESARLDDGVLRAEDGIALSFSRDRVHPESCEQPFFGQAHADVLKEIWIRCLLTAAEHLGKRVAMLWQWPRHANAVGCLTLDCENFEPEKVALVRRVLIMYGCRAAWLVAMPGYSIDIYRAIKSWDHELGVLFLVDNQSGWHEDKFKIQLTAMSRLAGLPGLTSVRPQDGRWKGWTSFYELCEEAGARISLSKGGRQPGTSGFPFGTCHPFFPSRRDGSQSLVMEIPYSVYSPGEVVQDSAADALLGETIRRAGCLHLVVRPEALTQPEMTASLRRMLSECRAARVPFLLPEEIYRHEKARRQTRLYCRQLGDEGVLQLSADSDVEGLSVLVSGDSMDAEVRGQQMITKTVVRYGRRFTALEVNLQAKQMVEVRLLPESHAQAA